MTMTQKNKIKNAANDVDLKEVFIQKTGNKVRNQGDSRNTGADNPDGSWVRFTVICSDEIVQKIKFIAHEEDFNIREVVEKSFQNTINSYEQKTGKKIVIKNKKKKDINSII